MLCQGGRNKTVNVAGELYIFPIVLGWLSFDAFLVLIAIVVPICRDFKPLDMYKKNIALHDERSNELNVQLLKISYHWKLRRTIQTSVRFYNNVLVHLATPNFVSNVLYGSTNNFFFLLEIPYLCIHTNVQN